MSSGNPLWFSALFRGVAASVEHKAVLRNLEDCQTIVDIGANRGQFALAARRFFPSSNIICFEPLPEPAIIFRRVFSYDNAVILHEFAIGSESRHCVMHVSRRDDSSSLLPISLLQEQIFPGTSEVKTIEVKATPLDVHISRNSIVSPAMLKLDVQGFELDALRGCESLLPKFKWIYCECSFVELYIGQHLVSEVIEWLSSKGFRIEGMYNPTYDKNGHAIQADFLFRRDHPNTLK